MRHLKQHLRLWLTAIMILSVFTTFTATAGDRMNKFPAENFFKPPMVKLLDSLQRGDEQAVKNQLAGGLSLNVIGEQGITPLFWLFINQDKSAAQRALRLGADPNFADGQDRTPVYFFAVSIFTDWLKMVLDAGGDPNEQYDGNPVLFSAMSGEKPLENTKVMVAYGADVNMQNNSGANSVLYATYVNKFGLALWLAEHGADICIADELNATPADMVKMTEDDDKEFGRPSTPDLLKFKALLESRHAYPPGPQSICRSPPSPPQQKAE